MWLLVCTEACVSICMCIACINSDHTGVREIRRAICSYSWLQHCMLLAAARGRAPMHTLTCTKPAQMYCGCRQAAAPAIGIATSTLALRGCNALLPVQQCNVLPLSTLAKCNRQRMQIATRQVCSTAPETPDCCLAQPAAPNCAQPGSLPPFWQVAQAYRQAPTAPDPHYPC